MNELEDLHDRLRNLIVNTCNTVGCKNCPFIYDIEDNICEATILQGRILDIEQEKVQQ